MKPENLIRMSQKWVNGVEPEEGQTKPIVYTDTQTDGLQLVVNPKGRVSWKLYFSYKGEVVPKTLGVRRNSKTQIGMSLDDARHACDKRRVEIQTTIDETGHAPRKGDTVEVETLEGLWKIFERHHSRKKALGTQEHYEMSYRRYVRDAFGWRPANEITTKMVEILSADVEDTNGSSSGAKVLMIINLIYNVCIKKDFYHGENPAKGLERSKPKERDRYLNEEERVKFFLEVEKRSHTDLEFACFLSLLIHTGQRSHSVAKMKWNQLNFNTKTWTIPASNIKGRKAPHVVMLTESALNIIRKFEDDRPYVLHSKVDVEKQLECWRQKWRHMRRKIGFDAMKDDPDNQVNLHDLRRTFGAILAQRQYSLHSIANALGQSSISSTSIYARLNAASMIDAFVTVEDVLLNREETS